KKFQSDLLTYLNISLVNPSQNSSPSKITGPFRITILKSSDISKSTEENLSSLQRNYSPEETIIANTTPNRKNTKTSNEEEAISDQKDTSLLHFSKYKPIINRIKIKSLR
ncbi:11513_t:CDS:2, partial [Funneliformis mosseae]